MTAINHNAVIGLFNKVRSLPQKNGLFLSSSAKSESGYMYVTKHNQVQIVLPAELIEYSNSRAGTMSGYRPVGIRTSEAYSTPELAAEAVANIFESVDSLIKFITSSECDGLAYAKSMQDRHKSRTKVKTKAKIKVAGPKVKTQEELDRAAAMDAVFARKDARRAAQTKELVMERVTNYARNKIKNLDTSVQKTILAALAGQRVRDLISDFESGQRVVNVMVNNAKSKVAV